VKVEDLRTLEGEELSSRLKSSRRELYELRFKLAVGQLDDHRQIRKVRKDIARILTVVHSRRLEGTLDVSVADLTGMDAVSLPEPAEAEEPAAEGAEATPAADAVAEPESGEETPENVEASKAGEADAPAPRRIRRRPAAEAAEEGND